MKNNILQRYAVFLCICLCAACLVSESPGQTPARQKVIVIPVSGEVGPAMAAFIERAFQNNTDTDALYVLEMDTFGGRVDSAFQIVDTLLTRPAGKTIAYVKKRAISAGALIALACNELVMKHSTTIGDCAPIILSNEGPKMLGEKFQSPLRAKFRTLAKRNGYPEPLAEAMVSSDITVYKIETDDGRILYMDSVEYEDLSEEDRAKVRSKKTAVSAGKLLTMDDHEALDFGFSSMSVESVEEMLGKKGIPDYEIVKLEESWSEQMVRFITAIAPFLMLVGFAGLYMEMQTPGFGIPGIVGILCLGLVFSSQYMVGLADHTELLLLMLGLMLLGVEMFVIPGFGVIGISGIALMAAGMVLSLQDFVIPEFPWETEILKKNIISVLGSLIGSFVMSLFFLRYVFPKVSRTLPGPYLSATLAHSHVDSDMPSDVLVGNMGVVKKTLRPAGSIRVGDEVHDVISEGEFIEKGETVIVTEIRSNRIMVARSSADEH
ncbi:NfeD family protein [Desulfococcaceae bacterium HSG8]|nr:NfeD family protein [Desulfococcaceae bacterium HSG8]